MRVLKSVPVIVLMVSGLLMAPNVAGASPIGHFHGGNHGGHHGHGPYVCSGGNILPGWYPSVVVTGVCYAPYGNVDIGGNLTVAPGALFDAVQAGDPTTGTAVLPATVDISGSAFVGQGAALLLGCSPNISCSTPPGPPGITFDTIGGSLFAFGAQGVVVHSASIGGSVVVRGGGGGAAADTCNAQVPGTPLVTNLEPWSEDPNLAYTPVYTDFEDDSIGGNLTVAGLDSCWLGSLRDQIGGSARFFNNSLGDPDALEIDNNVVHGDMGCANNTPAVQFGDSGSAPNLVGGRAFGECAFSVTAQNPAPGAGAGAGIEEHLTVSLWGLSSSHGSISQTSAASLPPVTTSAGDTINAELYNFTLAGSGLTGSGTYNSAMPPGASGEAVLSTTYPDGWTSFTAYLTCDCSYGGQTGTISIRAYGTVSPHGTTDGTFLITSGGGTATGSLSTLAGGGTFSSRGAPAGTLNLREHLEIT